MSKTIVIKINDARLVVAGDSGVVHLEPGFAVVDGGEIVTGHDAFARSRIVPRHTSHAHWENLSAESGSAGTAGMETSAELAFAQLESIWKSQRDKADSVIFVVPNDYSSHALGMLLGLAEECGIPVIGMVDAAVAASVQPYPGRQLLYVDASRHGVTVTPVEQGSEATSLEPARLDMGLASLMDSFARRIAELFVLETRFDPLHDAAAEQLIYDGLSGWLAALRNNESIPVELEYRGERFTIQLARRSLLGAAEGFFRALQQLVAQMRGDQSGLAIQLSDKLASIPGVIEALGRLDDAIIVPHEPGQAAVAIVELAGRLAGADGQVRLYRHLPWRREADGDEATPPAEASELPRHPSVPEAIPTHVVYRGMAYRVNGAGLTIGRNEEGEGRRIAIDDASQGISRSHCLLTVTDGELKIRDLSRYGTYVNERRVEGETLLRPADVIRIGSPGAELTVICIDRADEEIVDGA